MGLEEFNKPLTDAEGSPGALEADTDCIGALPLQRESYGDGVRYSNLDPTYDSADALLSNALVTGESSPPAPVPAPPAVSPPPQSSLPADRNSGNQCFLFSYI